ncbi:MAG: 16S rRNA (cytosine(1402)-N(4))-methyltransferase RsmH [Candidatus Shapirobacteria bacterium]
MIYHQPVLVDEVVKIFEPLSESVILDGTLGHAGHTLAFLTHGCPHVYGLDRDLMSLKIAKNRLKEAGYLPQTTLKNLNFTALPEVIAKSDPKINRILLDLGLNSFQLREGDQGFSFLEDLPLDMRLDPNQDITASNYLNTVSLTLLELNLSRLVQHPLSPILAQEIVTSRHRQPFTTTHQLANFMVNFYANHHLPHHTHPATKIFLMLRLIVNQELENLEIALNQIKSVASPHTRVAIITFHSTEDRIVKLFIQNNYPHSHSSIKPKFSEIKSNPLSRSAMLRWFET